jgi:cytochrome oxidase Cu insertion factor (SCO1/SenC/PrrC family)
MRAVIPGAALLAALLAMGGAAAHEEHRASSHAAADGYAFVPAPGSYRLPPIREAGGGPVLDEQGAAHDLARLLAGRITVMAFIYTRCGDACPTATLQMSLLQDAAARAGVSGRMRLVSMSFDPDHDTPEVMAQHALQWRSADRRAPEWLFLTGSGGQSLAPILAAYNQSVLAKPDGQSAAGPLSHIFRAFLVDREGRIRNIYSLDFFDPRLILNDVRTLLLDDDAAAQAATPVQARRRNGTR